MTPICAECRYSMPNLMDYDENGDEVVTPVLECRRFPPLMVALEDELVAIRPQVAETDTCGEYQP